MLIRLDRRCYAEDTGGAAGSAPDNSAVSAPDTSNDPQTAVQPVAEAPQPRRVNPLANVRYGRQPDQEPAAQTEEPTHQDTPQSERLSFEDLINGEYKDDYQRKIQATLQDRLKGSKAREEKIAPLIQALADQYGKNADDLDGIREAIDNDSARVEKTMLDVGVDERTAKRLAEIRANNERRKAEAEAARQEEARQKHYASLEAQAEQMKQMFPGFDLQRELADNRYFELTTPDKGLTLKEAYLAIHGDEIMASAMQYAVDRSTQKVAASVQANGRRPSEGGMTRSQPVEVKSDPTKLTQADRAEIRRRVALGDKSIVF